MFKKLLAVASALMIAAGLTVIAVAGPASAHHTDISATAVCTTDGGWDITWSVINSENFEGTITSSNIAEVAKGTLLPANPVYYTNKADSVPTTFVQHVMKNDPVALDITVTWFKSANDKPTNRQQSTFSAFPAGCADVETTPVAPAVTTVVKCDTEGTVTPQQTTGVTYTITSFDKVTGDYLVTATPDKGYFFKDDPDQLIEFRGNVGAPYDCVEKPTPRAVVGQCTYSADGSIADRDVTIIFDNLTSNTAVTFQVAGYPDTLVPAFGTASLVMPSAGKTGASYVVTAAGQTFPITIAPCDEFDKPDPKQRFVETYTYDCESQDVTVSTITYTTDTTFNTASLKWVELPEVASAPVITHRAFTAAETTDECGVELPKDPTGSACDVPSPTTELTRWIRVDFDTRINYTFENTVTHVITTPTEEFTGVDAGKYIVTAVAAPGYELQPEASRAWTMFIEDTTLCEGPTLALVTPTYETTPITCTAAGTYTLGELAPGTITWTVDGVETPVGTYKVDGARDVTISAAATKATDGLDPEWVNPLVLTFAKSTEECQLETLAFTGSGNGMFPLAGGMVLLGLGGLLLARRKWAETN